MNLARKPLIQAIFKKLMLLPLRSLDIDQRSDWN